MSAVAHAAPALPAWLWLLCKTAPHPLALDGRLLYHGDGLPVAACRPVGDDGLLWLTEDAVSAQGDAAVQRLLIFERPATLRMFDVDRLPGVGLADGTRLARAGGFDGISTLQLTYADDIGWFEHRVHGLFERALGRLRHHAIAAVVHHAAETDESATTPEMQALWASAREAARGS